MEDENDFFATTFSIKNPVKQDPWMTDTQPEPERLLTFQPPKSDAFEEVKIKKDLTTCSSSSYVTVFEGDSDFYRYL